MSARHTPDARHAASVFVDPPGLEAWETVRLRAPDATLHDFHALPVPALLMEPRTLRLLEVNRALLSFLGWSADDLLGEQLSELQPEQDRQELLTLIQRVPVERDVASVMRLKRHDGEQVTVRLDCRRVLYSGESAVMAVLGEDPLISDQQSRSRRLHKRCRDLLRHCSGVALEVDADLVIRDANAHTRELLGPGECIGRSLFDFVGPLKTAGLDATLQAMQPGTTVEANVDLVCGDGHFSGTIDATLVRFDEDGGAGGFYILGADRRRELHLEQAQHELTVRYSEIIAASLDAILIVDRQGIIQDANSEASRLLGYSMGELRGLSRERIFDQEDPRYTEALRHRDSTGLYHGQLSVRRINGSVFEAEVRSSLFQSASGELMASTILRDLTEFRRSQEERVLMNMLLRKLVDHDSRQAIAVALAELISSLVDFASFGLYRVDRGAGRFRAFCWRGMDPALIRAVETVPVNSSWSPVAVAATTGRPLLIENLRRSREWVRLHHTARLFHLEKLQALPLLTSQGGGSSDAVLMLYLNDYEHGMDPKSGRLQSLDYLVSLVFDTCDRIALNENHAGARAGNR